MQRKIKQHWSYLVTGPALAFLLILFWYLNQNYLSAQKGPVAGLLENPLMTFGLVILGAFTSAFVCGDFDIKMPVTYEPLVFALLGGFLMGIGASLAAMSVHSVVLFNLAGIFTLTAFMIAKGWIYALFMISGGFAGSRIFVYLTLKTGGFKSDFSIPGTWRLKRNQQRAFYVSISIFISLILAVLIFSPMNIVQKGELVTAIVLLLFFGMVVERGTVCMSSMLKEWFMARAAYVWRSVLFSIMCLALLYQAGRYLAFYPAIEVEKYISNPGLLVLGSFLMGFGFIFADGCFIGSLWKIGQGNLINVAGFWGMMVSVGMMQAIARIGQVSSPGLTGQSQVINDLSLIMNPVGFLLILWGAGLFLFIIFRVKCYRY